MTGKMSVKTSWNYRKKTDKLSKTDKLQQGKCLNTHNECKLKTYLISNIMIHHLVYRF